MVLDQVERFVSVGTHDSVDSQAHKKSGNLTESGGRKAPRNEECRDGVCAPPQQHPSNHENGVRYYQDPCGVGKHSGLSRVTLSLPFIRVSPAGRRLSGAAGEIPV